jgi:hypothetical protein
MSEVLAKPHRVRQWLEIAEGAMPDWDAVFAGYEATMDWPAAAYWRQLAAHYPEAKVVLSVRDPQRWYDSMRATIFNRALAERGRLPLRRRMIRWLVARRAPDFALYPRMAKATVMDGIFGGRIDDRAHVLQVFERHIADVKEAIPSHRLLVFDVREGWAPLCAFLGCPMPDEPFPRVNDSAEFHRKRPLILLRLILNGH